MTVIADKETVQEVTRAQRSRRPRDGTERASWFVRIAVLVIVTMWTIPTLGLFINSFRPAADSSSTGWWTSLFNPFQTEWTIDNYVNVLTSGGMFDAFINSLIVTIPATVIPITLAAFAAYGFAWMRFKGRSLLFAIIVGLLVVPLQIALVPLLVPLSVPALASFAIFQFLWVWNDFLVAAVFLGTSSDVGVLTIELASIVGSRGEAFHLLTAAAFVSMVVPLIVFLSLQRYFVRGLLAGSVKG